MNLKGRAGFILTQVIKVIFIVNYIWIDYFYLTFVSPETSIFRITLALIFAPILISALMFGMCYFLWMGFSWMLPILVKRNFWE